jgi:short-subunit dehydrogenase
MVTALGEALWGELAGSGIDVLTLCPGKTVSEALVKQGFDPSMLADAMPAREVARLALDHIADGPTYISSEHYAAMVERMSALPRRQALLASAAAMKQHMAARDASLFGEGQVRRHVSALASGEARAPSW